MKAMVLAAGLGTRLRPMTDSRPKALVEVSGRTLLEITLTRLREFGVDEVIVNVHHFADMVTDYLKSRNNFGIRIEISREEVLLDTGGGLRKAAWFFLDDPKRLDEPFVLHNVDVISSIDLHSMVAFHIQSQALATLAVKNRETSRYLLFDDQDQLCGRRAKPDLRAEMVRPAEHPQELAFSGIHVISPRALPRIAEHGIFSIINSYLNLAAQGGKILAFHADQYFWRDLGRPEHLIQAEMDLKAI
jgi:mannose-1-phosphate guanylyltransferase